jgi:GH24 family phage-related lysozyme (muramidase)
LVRRKKSNDEAPVEKPYPFLTDKGIEIIRKHTTPRTYLGMGRFASYKDYGEESWRIGYGSLRLGKRPVGGLDKASEEQIVQQLAEDLKEFSDQVAAYVFVPLNSNKKAALLSFAHSIGLASFKTCRLLELINGLAPRSEIIREWSPYINPIWRSGGEVMINRRRVEVDTYFAGDKEIPTLINHKCAAKFCLLNISETYKGTANQIKAIEYLERKLSEWDESGEVIRRFVRYWNEKPSGLSS